jgi:osmoprotectant transport system ATP-binding protein
VIAVREVSKRFGTSAALDGVTLHVSLGRSLALIGPSGSGKSTVLRLITGLEWPDHGRVEVSGEPVTPSTVAGIRERLGYLIQDGGLFPHLSCRRNVTLVAELRNMDPAATAYRVEELADLVRLGPVLLDRLPRELSGGQRQRVALMRALFRDPPVLLLDEPFGALDPVVRREVGDELFALLRRLEKTVLLVTHDVAEAAALTDEIAVLRGGAILQTGTVHALRTAPADPFVTQFFAAHRNLGAADSQAVH